MVKYLQVYQEMISQNQEVFDQFGIIHNQYSLEPKKYREAFNQVGEQVMTLIRRYEARLCSHSENSGFGKFSGGLTGKFWGKLKEDYPLIDEVGIKEIRGTMRFLGGRWFLCGRELPRIR